MHFSETQIYSKQQNIYILKQAQQLNIDNLSHI